MKKERQIPDDTLWCSDGGPIEIEVFNGGFNRYVNEQLDEYVLKRRITPDLAELTNVDTVSELEVFLRRI